MPADFVETFADGHIRGDASTGGMGNEIINGYWIKKDLRLPRHPGREGIPFKEIRYSYEHTPAVPFSSPIVFEKPASQVPSGAGPVTMWAELTGAVYNRVYTETLHATIDTTKPTTRNTLATVRHQYLSMADSRTSVNVTRDPLGLYQPEDQ